MTMIGSFSRWAQGIDKFETFRPEEKAFFDGMSFNKAVVWTNYAEDRGFFGRWKPDADEDEKVVRELPELEQISRAKQDYLKSLGINAEMERRDTYSSIYGYDSKSFRQHHVEFVIRYRVSADQVCAASRKALVAKIQSFRDKAGEWADRIAQSEAVEMIFDEVCALYRDAVDGGQAAGCVVGIGYAQNNVEIALRRSGKTKVIRYEDLGFKSFDDKEWGRQVDAFKAALYERLRREFDKPGETCIDVCFNKPDYDNPVTYDGIIIISTQPLPDPNAKLKSW